MSTSGYMVPDPKTNRKFVIEIDYINRKLEE